MSDLNIGWVAQRCALEAVEGVRDASIYGLTGTQRGYEVQVVVLDVRDYQLGDLRPQAEAGHQAANGAGPSTATLLWASNRPERKARVVEGQ